MEGKSIYRDYSIMRSEFRQGVISLADGDHDAALQAFAQANLVTPADDVFKNKYQSFYGLALIYTGHPRGIKLCHSSAVDELRDGDVFYNLARAELELGNRQTAIQALQRGLDIDKSHPGLIHLRQRIGIRRKRPLPFLRRSNPLNKVIGKLTYNRPHTI